MRTKEEIFDQIAKDGMNYYNQHEFREVYKSLFSCIIKSMDEYADQSYNKAIDDVHVLMASLTVKENIGGIEWTFIKTDNLFQQIEELKKK